jgi:hypothetical protein
MKKTILFLAIVAASCSNPTASTTESYDTVIIDSTIVVDTIVSVDTTITDTTIAE